MSSSTSEEANTNTLTENHYSCEFTPMPDPESSQSLNASEPAQEPDLLGQVLSKFQTLTVQNDTKERKTILGSFDLEGVAGYIKEKNVKNVICMCGAGISVNAGIPDFRSPETGIFSRLKEMGLSQPEDVFSIEFFRSDPKPFYSLAKELMPGKFEPTKAHFFMKLLQDKDMLLRVYTQNIDSLESQAGVHSDKLIAAHGNFDSAHCIYCEHEADISELMEHLKKGEVMKCAACQGTVKPDIVFYGESLPSRFFTCASSDFEKCDLLIVMGSSLVVNPFCLFVDHVTDTTPRLLINKEWARGGYGFPDSGFQRGPNNTRDVFHQGDCDDGVTQLASLLGYQQEFESLIQGTRQKE